MIEVDLPDGSVVEFPEGTPPEVMEKALQKRFGAPQQATTTPKTGRLPEDRGFFRKVDDAVRGVADMATFGLADEFSAGMGSLTGIGGQAGQYDKNLAAQRQRDEQGGMARLGGQVAGAFMLPGMAARSVPQAIGQGAVSGAAYGFGSGEGGLEQRAQSAGMGAAFGGAAGGALRGVANAIGNRAAAKSIPSNEQLRSAANAAYQSADNAGVIFKPEAVKRLANEIRVDLANFGFHPKLQPRIATVLDELERVQDGNVTMKGMDVLRRIANNARMSMDPSEKALGNQIVGQIDDFISSGRADDVLMGDAGVASGALRQGRDLWSRMRKSEMVDTAALKADRRAASTGSGGNADNALRQNVRSLLDNPKTAKGMTAVEKQAADRVVRGTTGQNALRLAGKLAPTGVVSGVLSGGAGYGLAGPAGLALPMLGQLAKSAADRMTVKNAERLSQIIRSGGRSAKDLAALARGGQMQIAQVKRVEQLAKMFGLTVPQLAALLPQYGVK